MTNITAHNTSELYDWFQNDEGLYNEWNRAIRLQDFDRLESLANNLFVFTEEQLDELRNEFMNESGNQ